MSDKLSDVETRLVELERWLGRAVGDVLTAALAVEQPGGDSPAWDQMMVGLEVARTEAKYRMIAASSTGQTHGAAADEVDKALEIIADRAKASLDHIDPPLSGPVGRHGQQLGLMITNIRGQVVAKYRGIVVPARGMFAAALASAANSQTSMPTAKARVLLCQNCGGPRLDDANFVCQFCGDDMAAQRRGS